MLYELPNFDYLDATSIEQALFWLQEYGNKAQVIAGGTDMLGLIKDRIEDPRHPVPGILINIKNIPDMNRLAYESDTGLDLGAAVRLHRLTEADAIKKYFPILSRAAQQVGTTQIRYMGTIGGNIFQRPRCPYFRHPDFLCYKKGGPKCLAVAGEHRYYHSIVKHGICMMAHPSDMAPVFTALNAEAVIEGQGGEKRVPFEDLFMISDHFTETLLESNEILKEIHVPPQKEGNYQLFLKHRIRHASDFSIVSLALMARVTNETLEDIRMVLGGIAPLPYIAAEAQMLLKGERLDKGLISKTADKALERTHPLPNNEYKVDLAKALIKRALTFIWAKRAGAVSP